jgi:hypothetical protein
MSDQPLDYLAATDDLLALFDEAPHDEFFGARLMRRSVERERNELLLRRFSGERQYGEILDLELVQSTSDGNGHGAEASLLADILGELQEAILAIAQSLRERPTSRGPVTADIRDAVKLSVEFALPGSLRLRLVPSEPVVPSLFSPAEDGESLLSQSLESLLSTLTSAKAGEREELLQQLASLGPRTAGHLSALSSSLDRANASMGLGWRSRQARRTVTFTRTDAHRLGSLLRSMESTERAHVVQGRLVGGSLVRRTFELELEDDSLMSGRVDEDVLPMLEELFGNTCTAHVLVTETTLASGETKDAYRLQRLDP